MTAFAGIDYDTFGIHVVFIPEEGPAEYHRFDLGDSEHALERARDVHTVMPPRGWWSDEGIVAVGLEEQASGNPAMRSTVQKLKMVQGAILSCLPRDLLVMPLEATRWRKELGLPGNAKKPVVAQWVLEKRMERSGFDIPAWPQDAADAFCMAVAVEKLVVLS